MNRCGECIACCDVFPIREIEKPKNQLCGYNDGKGCTVYGSRPKTCRTFKCGWLVGNWRDELRPDKAGVIIYKDKDEGHLAIMFKDAKDVNPAIMEQIEFIEKKYNVVIKGKDARK